MRRHAEAEDTWAAVAEVTWAVSAELALEVLAEVTWRAFTEVTLAMERAFAEVALQFQQRLRLGKLRYPAVTTVLMHPRQHLAQSQIRR
jgi:hypothetical protein